MDTIKKLSDYAILNGSSIRFMGVPKTIDNDLAVTDHTPGFGSAAKYIASITKEVIRDGLVYDQQNVTPVSYTHLDRERRNHDPDGGSGDVRRGNPFDEPVRDSGAV